MSASARLYDCPQCGTVERVISVESDLGDYAVTRCAECRSRVRLQ